MGLWDKPDFGRNLKELYDGRPFRIISSAIRENVDTMYGKNDAIDLTVDSIAGEHLDGPQVFSGFSAGILQMVRQADQKKDYPVWVRITSKPIGDGKSTMVLTPVSDDDVAAIEAGDSDDIPF